MYDFKQLSQNYPTTGIRPTTYLDMYDFKQLSQNYLTTGISKMWSLFLCFKYYRRYKECRTLKGVIGQNGMVLPKIKFCKIIN